METLATQLTGADAPGWRDTGRSAWLLVPLLLSLGCVTTGQGLPLCGGEPVCQVVATWNPQVASSPDPARGGQSAPGLVGRLYLFGEEVKAPLQGDGSAVVHLYDDAPLASGGKPVLLEEWRFDKDTLKRLQRKDAFGWGYTLFLPWGTYRPDLKVVHFMVCYQPAKGTPFYADSGPVSLAHGAPLPPMAAASLAHRGPPPAPPAGGPANAQGPAPGGQAVQQTSYQTAKPYGVR